jgi:anti-sigma B factor antagonist
MRNAQFWDRPKGTVMDIRIVERPIGDVTVLDIVGKLVMDRSAQHLKDKIYSLISQKRTQVVLNLKDVPYIDSSGLGELVAAYGSVMKAGGTLKLLNVTSRNHDLLSITRLVTVFESFDSESEAVRSFQTLAPMAVSR